MPVPEALCASGTPDGSLCLSFVSAPTPVGLGRGAQPKTDQGERLSERSEFELDPVFGAHRRLPRSEAKGTQTIGSPFLLLTFLLATQKKSELPPGNPRLVGTPLQPKQLQ